MTEPCRATCACEWEGPVTEWVGAAHAARLAGVPVPPLEHRIVKTEMYSCLSGPTEDLACACGWFGRSSLWASRSHAAMIPGAPIPPRQVTAPRPLSSSERRERKESLRAAIYGERRGRRYC